MFWVVDNFLMKKHRTKAKPEDREEDSRGNSKVRYRRALSHDDSESEVSLSVVKQLYDTPGIKLHTASPISFFTPKDLF